MVPHKRTGVTRRIVRTINAATARETIGEITPGCEIFGVNKGQFSLIDIIALCLEATGPADVLLSTWTAANADMGFAYELLRSDKIRSIRFVVDFSFPTRQPEYSAALRARFGDDCIRVTKTHAKFVTIRNEHWNLVIRSSMNLNENKRLESFEISDDAGMAGFLANLVTDLFASQAPGEGFSSRPYDNVMAFERFASDGTVDEAASLQSTDAAKYFGQGRYSNDIRRAGRVVTR